MFKITFPMNGFGEKDILMKTEKTEKQTYNFDQLECSSTTRTGLVFSYGRPSCDRYPPWVDDETFQ